ncbi:MAG: CYTH domain-containing protein [Ruminococcus bicirculans (ex Wegman et al. 2014)]
MSENIEREIKISLTQEQYKTAEKLFQWGKIIEQTNFYYIPQQDTGMTSIRVRQIGEKYFLQLKAPISENGALHVKKEYEQQLDSLPETLTAQELSQLVGRDFPAADLAGSLHTQRKLCTDFDHVEICLDKSEYLGLTDYELELEYTADYPEKPLEILKMQVSHREKR